MRGWWGQCFTCDEDKCQIIFAYSVRQPLANEKIVHCAEAKKQKYFSNKCFSARTVRRGENDEFSLLFMLVYKYRRKFNNTKWKKNLSLLNVLEKDLIEYIINTKKRTVKIRDRLLSE